MKFFAVLCNGFYPAFSYMIRAAYYYTYVPVLVERNFPISKKGKCVSIAKNLFRIWKGQVANLFSACIRLLNVHCLMNF